jgi:NADPH-dependent 2,4-dienoyl-CoA reductase/sulfur reductase-like enzyme
MLESRLPHFRHALVVGGGFIGMELAAALRHKGKDVTLLYPQEYPLRRVLPRELGLFVADYYRQQGVDASRARGSWRSRRAAARSWRSPRATTA